MAATPESRRTMLTDPRSSWFPPLACLAALAVLIAAGIGLRPVQAQEPAAPAAPAATNQSASPEVSHGKTAATESAPEESQAAGEAGHEEGAKSGHGEEEAKEGPPELPNIVQLLYEYEHEKALQEGTNPNKGVAGFLGDLHKGPIEKPLPIVGRIPWEVHVFAFIAALFIVFIFWLGVRKLHVRTPSRWQSLVETIIEGFDNFIVDILGPKHGRRFAPYIMALFLFILVNNLMVLVPFMASATSSLVLTGSLALLTFVIVQFTAVINLGPLGYFYHLLGEPQGKIMWIISPLLFALHVIGELARPVSLSLRLFGNVLGEDILLGAFMVMGIGLAGWVGIHPPAPGIPLHFPFMFLVLLTSTIQALVFSLLTTIYILLVLPHDHGHDEEELTEKAHSAVAAGSTPGHTTTHGDEAPSPA